MKRKYTDEDRMKNEIVKHKKKIPNKKVQVLYWIPMGMFPSTVMFSCGFSYDELIKQLKKKKAREWLEVVEGHNVIRDFSNTATQVSLNDKKTGKVVKYYTIVLKNSFDFSDYHFCVLAHEILHICQFFLPEVMDRAREFETEAYLHTFLMKSCLKIIRGNP